MSPRANPAQLSAAVYKKYLDFSQSVKDVDVTIRDLVNIRASQMNGCAFCLDMHVKEARLHGERELRLHHVVIWRESSLFTPRERAALAWTEVLTHLPPGGVPDEAYEAARAAFTEKELSDLTFAVIAINGWNRLSVAYRNEPGALDALYGLDKAGLT